MEQQPNPYASPANSLSDSQIEPPSLSLRMLATLGRGITYGLCIWSIYGFVIHPFLTDAGSDSGANEAQLSAYQEQLKRSNAMLAESERQQKHMAELLVKQEEQAQRMDRILSAWERQSGAATH